VGTNGNGVDVLGSDLVRLGGHRPDPKDPGALSDGSVTCLAEGPNGSAWVATLDGNLHRLRPGARRFEQLTVASGLPGGPIPALTLAPDGALWAGAAEGLARIDPATARIAVFHHRPDDPASLSSDTVERSLATAAAPSSSAFPTAFLLVRPQEFAPRTYAPPVVATALRFDGVERAWRMDQDSLENVAMTSSPNRPQSRFPTRFSTAARSVL
jgi:hypothetical protein